MFSRMRIRLQVLTWVMPGSFDSRADLPRRPVSLTRCLTVARGLGLALIVFVTGLCAGQTASALLGIRQPLTFRALPSLRGTITLLCGASAAQHHHEHNAQIRTE